MKGEIEAGAFITSESSAGEYRVIIRCSSMEAMHKAHRAVLELVYEVDRQASERVLARRQPCGCMICICEDDEQCQGCGAKSCGTHPVGEIPNPVYVNRYDPDPIVSKAWLKKLNAWDELLGEVKKQGIPRYMRHQVQAMRNGLRGYRDHGWKYEASKDVAEKGAES